MKVGYLDKLNTVVETFLGDDTIKQTIQNLKMKIRKADEPFIWNVINFEPIQQNLPLNIKSGWIFVLKKATSYIAHYHPNSVQHTILVEGKGKVRIKDQIKDLKVFDSSAFSEDDMWCVVDKNVPHEFFPKGEMVVISFHTCLPDELIEIKYGSGEKRTYKKLEHHWNKTSQA
jgi:mannose-6-phosphate isomerase-like protein (cupin superfamily)